MTQNSLLFTSWYNVVAFWSGSAMVAVGVGLHLPMFLMGRHTAYRLAGMPMDNGMLVGMALIVLGLIVAAYGLLPAREPQHASTGRNIPPEDAPLSIAHWIQICLIG